MTDFFRARDQGKVRQVPLGHVDNEDEWIGQVIARERIEELKGLLPFSERVFKGEEGHKQRAALMWYFGWGADGQTYTTEEIAKNLGVPNDVARTLVRDAIRKLRERAQRRGI